VQNERQKAEAQGEGVGAPVDRWLGCDAPPLCRARLYRRGNSEQESGAREVERQVTVI
jgi:hypothetical protein